MNAFERDGRIVVDGCRASAMPTSFGDDPVPEQGVRPYLWQWEIDPAAGTVTDRQLDDRTGDFPRINDAAHGKPYRFGYHAHTSSWDQGEGVWFDGVIQFDHATGGSAEFVLEEGSVMGEVAFAADPTGSAENDGWLVAFASDLARNTSEFLVIDARDVASGPVARVELPRRVPFGFHGNWMPTT
jgi:carotenoid cleavage dioxygenase